MSEKLMVRVADALLEGAATSEEIAVDLGLSVKTVSATFSELKKAGMLVSIGRIGRFELCELKQ